MQRDEDKHFAFSESENEIEQFRLRAEKMAFEQRQQMQKEREAKARLAEKEMEENELESFRLRAERLAQEQIRKHKEEILKRERELREEQEQIRKKALEEIRIIEAQKRQEEEEKKSLDQWRMTAELNACKQRITYLKEKAKQGDLDSQLRIAELFLAGYTEYGVCIIPKEKQQAEQWYRLAAEQGHTASWLTLGKLYNSESDNNKNFEDIFECFLNAAKSGYTEAMEYIAIDGYIYGKGTEKNLKQAQIWIKRIIECGDNDDTITSYDRILDLITDQEDMLSRAKCGRAESTYTIKELAFPAEYSSGNMQTGYQIYKWQLPSNKQKHFVIPFSKDKMELSSYFMNQLVMNMMLAFPVNKTHLHIVDLQMNRQAGSLAGNLNEKLCSIITDDAQMQQMCSKFNSMMTQDMRRFSTTIEEYNTTNNSIETPYHIVLLTSYPEAYERYQDMLLPIFKNGANSGIYFVILNNLNEWSWRTNGTRERLITDSSLSNYYYNIPFYLPNTDTLLYLPTHPFFKSDKWFQDAYDYLNVECTKEKVYKHNWDEQLNSPYKNTFGELKTPIGYNKDGSPFYFKMDITQQHYHAFLIGGTGSGKSRFLHDIIISLTSVYSPETLQLYLLDFKGVEFNSYRYIKHVKTILVDRTDEVLIYQVVKDLKTEMEHRQRVLAENECVDVDEYNKRFCDKKLPQIIFIADECQILFAEQGLNYRISNDIIAVLGLVAQQGRAYGIHLLLATQSLSNAPRLDKSILNQIREHYILPCKAEDAVRLVDDNISRQVENIVNSMTKNKGQCLYQGEDGICMFNFNYIPKGEEQKQLTDKVKIKAENYNINYPVYFSGSLMFDIETEITPESTPINTGSLMLFPGKEVSLGLRNVCINLKKEEGENVILMGINEDHYVTRVTMNFIYSIIKKNISSLSKTEILVINCLDSSEAEYYDVLQKWHHDNKIKILGSSSIVDVIQSLCDDIYNAESKSTVLVIIGQERFMQLKKNQSLQTSEKVEDSLPDKDDFAGTIALFDLPDLGCNPKTSHANLKNMKEAMEYLLKEGPQFGVHTILQLDKPSNFFHDSYNVRTSIFSFFTHTVLMRMEDSEQTKLDMPSDIKLNEMENIGNRLRAYYYNEQNDKYQLFVPFVLPH